MSSVTIQEAQNRLTELIHGLKPGDEVIITENDQPVARLTLIMPSEAKASTARHPQGSGSPDRS